MRDNPLKAYVDDAELIQGVLGGKTDQFAPLILRYQAKVRGYCAHILLDRSAAEDAAQDVFIKAFHNLERFRGESKFSTWLYRITVNHCRDLLRDQVRRPSESWDALSFGSRERAAMGGFVETPAEAVEKRDTIAKVYSRLSREYREVLVLREGHDLSYEQIAEALDCSLDAVKARLRRARAELVEQGRHFLEPENVRIRHR